MGQMMPNSARRNNRVTIRKGVHELKSGIECADNFQGRGRKKAEEKIQNF